MTKAQCKNQSRKLSEGAAPIRRNAKPIRKENSRGAAKAGSFLMEWPYLFTMRGQISCRASDWKNSSKANIFRVPFVEKILRRPKFSVHFPDAFPANE
jgi:hypothetical protein